MLNNIKLSKLRVWVAFAGIAVIIAATAGGIGLGTYCIICPVGFLQVTAASGSIPMHMLMGVGIGLAVILILGKVFCAWLCPTPLVKKTLGAEKPQNGIMPATNKMAAYLPYAVLALAVVLSFIVQFPVFCLVCPIGLFFGFIYALFRLFHQFDPSWNLLIFPLILGAELLLFKKWCTVICPVSALFTFVRKVPFPKKLAVHIEHKNCLHFNGSKCRNCSHVCPAEIDVTAEGDSLKTKCISCFECKDDCPTQSINIF